MSSVMRIAYLVNQYPTISHIFIRREILSLERRGLQVMRIALREWEGKLVDPEDHLERVRTRYVLGNGASPLLLAFAQTLVTRPVRLLQALMLALRMGRHGERAYPVHLAYLAEACRIAIWLRAAGVQHLHAHFGTNSAEIAMLAHALGGPQWSFTVHGPKEYDNVRLVGLTEKIQRCAFVVAITSYGRSQLYRLVSHQHWSKVRVVHCGLEPAFFAIPVNLPPAVRRFVCVGRLVEQKGQLLLVDAARKLAELGTEFELVLVGGGEMRSEIEAAIERYGLQARVRITGGISSEQLREEILAARAIVLPSFAEGLPMVLMEAMALRRPVISTFIAGIPELVEPGKHGWLIPAGDVEALMHAMQACLDTPIEALARMGEAAHQRVIERHSADPQAAQLAELFESAIEGSRAMKPRRVKDAPERAAV
jgi:glycosyltransferase involved in cell wall biosynthesis